MISTVFTLFLLLLPNFLFTNFNHEQIIFQHTGLCRPSGTYSVAEYLVSLFLLRHLLHSC